MYNLYFFLDRDVLFGSGCGLFDNCKSVAAERLVAKSCETVE